jgi:Domain of unknown function (DUF6484)
VKPNDDPKLQADPFVTPEPVASVGDSPFETLSRRPLGQSNSVPLLAPSVGCLHGFDLLDRPLVGALKAAPGGVYAARSTVALKQAMLGREVLVVFEDGLVDRPVIVGVIESQALRDESVAAAPGVSLRVDGERHCVEAEREIVLKCGEASITLTRAGKVIIRGSYILSRSTGYNKIKGAAIDIN